VEEYLKRVVEIGIEKGFEVAKEKKIPVSQRSKQSITPRNGKVA